MDESSQKKKLDAIVTAINMAAMGAGIAAAVLAANKSKSTSTDAARIEKSINELATKFDRITEQLKSMQPEVSTATKQSEKKPESVQQPHNSNNNKPQQDVIYVRKSSEFSFYN